LEDEEQRVAATANPGLPHLSTLEGTAFCRLGTAHRALLGASSRLSQDPSVTALHGTVTALDGEPRRGGGTAWTATISDGQQVQVERVLLVPGAEPRRRCGGGVWREVSIEEALDESRLRMLISEEGLSRWGVIGGSHSGMLAVMNLTKALLQRDQSSMCIKQRESETTLVVSAYKSSLLYAERRSPVTPGGRAWTKHDGAGLKGPVAAWCRKHFGVGNSVSGEAPPLQGFEVTAAIPRDHTATCRVLRADVGRVALEEVLREQGIEAVVNATGFAAPSSLPAVTRRQTCRPSRGW